MLPSRQSRPGHRHRDGRRSASPSWTRYLTVLGATLVVTGLLLPGLTPQAAKTTRDDDATRTVALALPPEPEASAEPPAAPLHVPAPPRVAPRPTADDATPRQSVAAPPTPPPPPAASAEDTREGVPAGTEAPVGDVPSKAPQGEPPPQWEWQDVTVARGDNLSLVFHRLGLSAATLHRVLALGEPTQALHDLRPGQVLRFAVAEGPPPRLSALEYHPDPVHYLRIERDGDGFRAELHERPVQVRSARAAGVIHDSLFASAARAGLTDRIIMGLAQVFGWDIDFALDIREGDRFAVVYEERYLDDRKVEDGPVLAAEFVNRGKTYRALRYTDSTGRSGYYTPDGHNLRRAFLRTPVEFSRISSRFSLGRYHPVLHRIRAHKGVDYAARTGTPVRATADGKVVFKGRHGGYGRVVRLQHGSRYMTVYAHLSRYARGLRQGKWVKQGQVIGYVGQSGLATGPHLHYEFRVNGVHKDPLTVALPAADPIDPRYLSDFKAKTRTLVAALDALAGTAVALGRP